jgi:signal transduction histidine kinase
VKSHGRASPGQWLRRRRRVLLVDGSLAVATVLVELLLTAVLPADLRQTALAAAVGCSALCTLPIVIRRAAPWPSVAACLIVLTAVALARIYPLSHLVSIMVVSYTTAARFPVRPATVAGLLLWLPVAAVNAALGPEAAGIRAGVTIPGNHGIADSALVALVLFFVGRTVHGRRTSNRALRERAAAAEMNQRALAQHAVADERRRIARELHDVVAHHISVIGVLATGARRVLHRRPDDADEALETIADTSGTTLREMRRLLDVLRADDDPYTQLTPQPGLTGIEALVDQVREAGLATRLQVEGTPVPLEAGVALAVYRIVQEALTNALKHAAATQATVRLHFDPAGLTVQVSDDGHGPFPHSGAGVGHGLVGMRERVALYGGTLRTGHRPGGGFMVDARLPSDQLGPATAPGTTARRRSGEDGA